MARRKPASDAEKWARDAGAKETQDQLLTLLRTRQQWKTVELAEKLGVADATLQNALSALRDSGFNVHTAGYTVALTKAPEPRSEEHIWESKDGTYRFGVISDTHYGSKYAREDVADSLYDWFAAEGIERVYHAGNWIEGEARFNKFDLIPEAHGMQAQLDYFVEKYPQRKGITTYYVTGDDHEGWYSQNAGVDIGRALMDTAHRAGRHDLFDLGYMEAFVRLQRRGGGSAKMLVCHPGGGSSYALSYAPQKVIESLQPGEKPGIILFGHWHKLEVMNVRGLWAIQCGCTKDTDPFARKKRLSYQIGGLIVELKQDKMGALYECTPRIRQFWDRSYQNDNWSHSHVPTKRRA